MTVRGNIPVIDIGPIFGPLSHARDTIDRRLIGAASETGFMTITGFPSCIDVGTAMRSQILRLFNAPGAVLEKLSSNRQDPSRSPAYRGWFSARADRPSYFDGIEIGPDIAHGERMVDLLDPLKGPTPMPSEEDLPGWRNAVRSYYLGMEYVADALIRSMARGLCVPEEYFAAMFADGISTLRLLRYSRRPDSSKSGLPEEELYVEHDGLKREVVSEAHVDFGFMTLLVQDGVAGLQARVPDGSWIDIPPTEDHIVVNFGKLLERWSGGRIRATEHRVLSSGRDRFSLPFFYEPQVDAEIAPLPLPDSEQFTPFRYGDHVWSSLPRLRRRFGERRNKPQ